MLFPNLAVRNYYWSPQNPEHNTHPSPPLPVVQTTLSRSIYEKPFSRNNQYCSVRVSSLFHNGTQVSRSWQRVSRTLAKRPLRPSEPAPANPRVGVWDGVFYHMRVPFPRRRLQSEREYGNVLSLVEKLYFTAGRSGVLSEPIYVNLKPGRRNYSWLSLH